MDPQITSIIHEYNLDLQDIQYLQGMARRIKSQNAHIDSLLVDTTLVECSMPNCKRGVENQHSILGICISCAEAELSRLRAIENGIRGCPTRTTKHGFKSFICTTQLRDALEGKSVEAQAIKRLRNIEEVIIETNKEDAVAELRHLAGNNPTYRIWLQSIADTVEKYS